MPSSGVTPCSMCRSRASRFPCPCRQWLNSRRVYRPALAINADPAPLLRGAGGTGYRGHPIRAVGAHMHEKYTSLVDPSPRTPGDVHMGPIITWLRDKPARRDTDPDQRRGQLRHLGHRYNPLPQIPHPGGPRLRLDGYGVPAALAAQAFRFPNVWCGLRRRRLLHDARSGIRHLIQQQGCRSSSNCVNNSMYANIRMHQEAIIPAGQRHRSGQPGFPRPLARA